MKQNKVLNCLKLIFYVVSGIDLRSDSSTFKGIRLHARLSLALMQVESNNTLEILVTLDALLCKDDSITQPDGIGILGFKSNIITITPVWCSCHHVHLKLFSCYIKDLYSIIL